MTRIAALASPTDAPTARNSGHRMLPSLPHKTQFGTFALFPGAALRANFASMVPQVVPFMARAASFAFRLLCPLLLCAAYCHAQEGRTPLSKPDPAYPALARQLHLAGVVRVKAVISADGQVKEVQVLGGHPLLADAATEVLKKWKFAPAKAETPVTLEFRFQP